MSVNTVNIQSSSDYLSSSNSHSAPANLEQGQSARLKAIFEKIIEKEEAPSPPKVTLNEKNIIKIIPYFFVIGSAGQIVASFLLYDFNTAIGPRSYVGLAFAIVGMVLSLFSGISSIPLSKKETQLQNWTQSLLNHTLQNKRDLRLGLALDEFFKAKENILGKAQDCLNKLFQCSKSYRDHIDSYEGTISEILEFIQDAASKGLITKDEIENYKDLYYIASELLKTIENQALRLDEMRQKGIDDLKGEKLGLLDNTAAQYNQDFSKLQSKFKQNWSKAQNPSPIDINYLKINGRWITRNAIICDSEDEAKQYSKETDEIAINNNEVVINIKKS